jgi:transposase
MRARSGLKIGRAGMGRGMQALAAMTEPLLALMKTRVLEAHVIRGEETPVKQQAPGSGRGKTKSSYFYNYPGDEEPPSTGWDDRGPHARAGPTAWFSDEPGDARYHGILQCEAYTGYHELFDPNKTRQRTQVGCGAPARRKFYDGRDQCPGPCHHGPGQLRQLYAVEREATNQQLDAQQH